MCFFQHTYKSHVFAYCIPTPSFTSVRMHSFAGAARCCDVSVWCLHAQYSAAALVAVIAGIRHEEDGDRLKQYAPEKIHPITLDVTSDDSVRIAIADVKRIIADDPQGLYALINNAGELTLGLADNAM